MTVTEWEAFLAYIREQRAEAGLPETIDDPAAIAVVARVLRQAERKEEAAA